MIYISIMMNYDEYASEYAEKTFRLPDADEDLKSDAYFIHAKANLELKDYVKSETSFHKVVELTKDIRSGEALYHIALFRYLEGEYEESEAACQNVVRQKPGYNYWIAKAIILLSDNFVAQEDYFNAKHSLQSIIDNYQGDDDIIQIAEEKLQIVIELGNEKQIQEENFRNEESSIDFMIDELQNLDELNLFIDEENETINNKE